MHVLWEWFLSHTAFALVERMPSWLSEWIYSDRKLSDDLRVPAFGGATVDLSISSIGERKKVSWLLDVRNGSRIYHGMPVVVHEVVWSIVGVLGQRTFNPASGSVTPLEIHDLLDATELKLLKSRDGEAISVTATASVSIRGRRVEKLASFTGKINAKT
jgi:hypothetical protein